MDSMKMLDLCSSSSQTKSNFSMPLNRKYRDHLEIIALLLEAAKDNRATMFSIMKHANTNYKQLKKYLHSLIEIGFVEMDTRENQCLYRISEKGLSFLRQYYVLLGMLAVALTKNKSGGMVYEAGYDAIRARSQSATELVTSVQHKS